MDNQENKDLFDLGSAPTDTDIDPFALDENELDFDTDDSATSEQQAQEPPKVEVPAKKADEKETKTEQTLDEKLPIFEYAGATENIDDTAKTFDELRIEKSADFPELEDGKRVSWTVEYGKITKTVTDPKGTSIGKIKVEIEGSKAFIDGLKKAKDKNPTCKVKPRVTAQSKGITAAYRGVFTNMEQAEAAGKIISIFPAKDGKVYEMRNTEMGRFVTPIVGCDLLSDVQAGFDSALPLIPMREVMAIISFFRFYMRNGSEQEALVNIYWDKQNREYVVDAPEQTVTKASVEGRENSDYINERYIHFMDIHSHNSMEAFFSPIDDKDEKATRLYTVIGRLDKYLPDVKTRISNGGKFQEIDPAEVFEMVARPFPDEWKNKVHFRASHGADKGFVLPTDGEVL